MWRNILVQLNPWLLITFFHTWYLHWAFMVHSGSYFFKLRCIKVFSPKLGFKGVTHPSPIMWLFMHFSTKIQHFGDKKDMFLINNIPKNLITELKFHYVKWLLIYGWKHGKYWFSQIVYCNFTTMVCAEAKLWFLSPLEHFWRYL